MDCQQAQELILDAFEGPLSFQEQREVESHVGACVNCRSFAQSQKTLERRLEAAVRAPELSPAFRSGLRQRIRREPLTVWPDSMPDIVHVASCGVVTVACAALLPFPAVSVLAIGVVSTGVTYLFQSAVRGLLEELGETEL